MTNPNKNMWVRIGGWVATVVVTAIITNWIAWHPNEIGMIFSGAGGIFLLIGVIIALGGITLVIFWPAKWPEWIRKIAIVIALFVALFAAGEPLRDAFANAPWLLILALIGVIMLPWVLGSLSTTGRLWLPRRTKKSSTEDEVIDGEIVDGDTAT